jgi:hypothetical protein
MTNTRKLRCISISTREQNVGGNPPSSKWITDRGFSSVGEDGKQLNGSDVQSVSFSDSVIGDAQDTSIKGNDIITLTIETTAPAAPASSSFVSSSK